MRYLFDKAPSSPVVLFKQPLQLQKCPLGFPGPLLRIHNQNVALGDTGVLYVRPFKSLLVTR